MPETKTRRQIVRDDTDILTAVAKHPICGRLSYERFSQDRRTYYRLLSDSARVGITTDASHARETIAYWRENGWLQEAK